MNVNELITVSSIVCNRTTRVFLWFGVSYWSVNHALLRRICDSLNRLGMDGVTYFAHPVTIIIHYCIHT